VIRLSFSEEDIKELDWQRYHHPHPRVQKKMEVLLLRARGLPTEDVAQCVGICLNTVRSYLRAYERGGIEALKQVRFRQPQSELQAYQSSLEAHFREHPPTSIAHATEMIEQLTGVKRSHVQIGIFLKKIGLKRLKTYAIPAKCDIEAQETFKKKS
jgi:transposase